MRPLLLAVVLLAAACGGDRGAATQAPPGPATISSTHPGATSAPSPTVTAVPTPSLETSECGTTPPIDFSLLCQTYGLIADTYLEVPDPQALAAAAVLGVDQVEAVEEGGGSGPSGDGPFHCTLPDAAFEPLCEALLDRSGAAPLPSLVEGAVQGMFRYGLDPFSSYVSPTLADRLDAFGSGLVLGLGVIVGAVDSAEAPCGPIGADCRFIVLSVFDFTPASAAGLVAGDEVVEVDGTPLEGLSGDEATALLHGEAGRSVEIVLDRAGDRLSKTVVREDVRLEPVEYAVPAPGIAYLRLNDFSQVAAQLTGRVLQLEEVAGASGMVLDLRDNPGGLVLSAQAVASQFLDGGDVMVEHLREGSQSLPVVEGGLARDDMELVVLVNQGSASASEVVAAVLQERGRATVVGTPTFGKNMVQDVHRARNGGEIRLTVARWTTPGGLDVGVRGLEPDVEVEATGPDEGDPVLERALALLLG